VLDLDSPEPDRFGEADEEGLARLAKIYVDAVD